MAPTHCYTKTLMGVSAGVALGAAAMHFLTCPFKKAAGPPAGEEEKVESTGRKYLIGGNWKCNLTKEKVAELVAVLNAAGPIPSNVEVVVAPPAIFIPMVQATLRSDIAVAVQNCGDNAKQGAYTGELCADQVASLGIKWAIIGHSERRQGFPKGAGKGEENALVVKKAKLCVDQGLFTMLCIGETLEERKGGVTMKVLAAQLEATKNEFTEQDWEKVAIAYEPVWAIGTGETATPEQAQATHLDIRAWISANVSPAVAAQVRIQYGGSMSGKNAKDLLAQPDIDGGLIGGASLKADFFNVINGAN